MSSELDRELVEMSAPSLLSVSLMPIKLHLSYSETPFNFGCSIRSVVKIR